MFIAVPVAEMHTDAKRLWAGRVTAEAVSPERGRAAVSRLGTEKAQPR